MTYRRTPRSSHALRVGCGLALIAAGMPWEAAQAATTVSCTVSAGGIAFGVYNPLNTSATTSTGTLQIACTGSGTGSATLTPTITFSTGLSGAYSTRKMFSGANVLNYNIYWSTAYQQIMGDGTGGSFGGSTTTPLVVYPGRTSYANGTMYGLLPASQDVAPGTYADTIMVTVTY